MTSAPIINVPEEKEKGLVTQHEPDQGDSGNKQSVDDPMKIRHAFLSVTFYKPLEPKLQVNNDHQHRGENAKSPDGPGRRPAHDIDGHAGLGVGGHPNVVVAGRENDRPIGAVALGGQGSGAAVHKDLIGLLVKYENRAPRRPVSERQAGGIRVRLRQVSRAVSECAPETPRCRGNATSSARWKWNAPPSASPRHPTKRPARDGRPHSRGGRPRE